MNIREAFNMVDKNQLVLPDFQRGFVWKKDKLKSLAASVLLDLPIGSFLILNGECNDFETKRLGYTSESTTATEECKFLLDGQQRLTSLRVIFGNFIGYNDNWKEIFDGIYPTLRSKWFLKINPEKDEEDLFGFKNLIFDKNKLRTAEPSQLENMIIDKVIYKNKVQDWWHPDCVLKDKDDKELTIKDGKKYLLHVSQKMVEENLLPLSIYDKNGELLLDFSLDYISDKICKDLKIELEKDLSKVDELLEKANINTIYDDITVDKLDSILAQLKGKWKIEMYTFLKDILDKFKVETLILESNEIGRAVIIFERINKGGTRLDNFDLVSARAARDKTKKALPIRVAEYLNKEINLPESITYYLKSPKPQKINIKYMNTVKDNEINTIIKKQYLNLLSIMSNVEYGNVDDIKLDLTKKEKILNIPYDKINNLTEIVLKGISRACAFLQIRCGIVKINDLHYTLMLLPISYLLIDDKIWNSEKAIDKIEYWYWSSIFTGEYRMYQNQKSLDDLIDLFKWIAKDIKCSRYDRMDADLFKIKDFSEKEILVRDIDKEIPEVIHNTILQYELSRQPVDLLYDDIILNSWEIAQGIEKNTKEKKVKIEVQDHHIIPLGTSINLKQSTKEIRKDKMHILNSILNRTYILGETNNIFGTKDPSKYLKSLEENDKIHMLNTHFIPDNYKDYFKSDLISDNKEIKKFYNQRFEKLKTIMMDELNTLKN
ncbi:MAG TPA: DUF262 domain-containing protein [Clostridium perfringens]|nr:DUF262 domain-containing protein [Clostridium perfringens]